MTAPLTVEEIAELRSLLPWHRLGDANPDTLNDRLLAAAKRYGARLLDELERARALLKRIEWSRMSEATGSFEASCPVCQGAVGHHKPDCELAALIS